MFRSAFSFLLALAESVLILRSEFMLCLFVRSAYQNHDLSCILFVAEGKRRGLLLVE